MAGVHLLNSLCLSSQSLLMMVTVNLIRDPHLRRFEAAVTEIHMFISDSPNSWYTLFFAVCLYARDGNDLFIHFVR